MFRDRIDAGIQLADKLAEYKNQKVVVLAIPRGGLPIGAIVAKALKAPLDVALSKKIGHPYHKEYAIGAVSMEDMVLTDSKGISKEYLEEETARIRKKLRAREAQYYQNRKPWPLKGKTVIIIDDGIATGNTLLVTVDLVSHQNPDKIIVAIPVAPESGILKLKGNPNIDEVICLEVPHHFQAVGQFYEAFEQVSDKEAI
ncbi:MAG: phosphoribosyltransferase family protein, partial [Flavobacteriaceae bacterium]